MIATGTDVKPLEVLLFMRDVKSSNYFEQMKGRGTRTISFDDLKKVTRAAKHTKTHFIIVDAIGVAKSRKTDSRPLERKRTVALKDLLGAVSMGVQDEDLFTSLANRLIRLEKQITEDEKDRLKEISGGEDLKDMSKNLLDAYNPDLIEMKTLELVSKIPESERTPLKEEECRNKAKNQLATNAAKVFTGELNEYIENVRKIHEQIIDNINQDKILRAEFDSFTKDKAKELVKSFEDYIEENKDEIIALSIFYNQPYRMKELTFEMIKDLFEKLKTEKPLLAPHYVWDAYSQLEDVKESSPINELVALVSLVRRVSGIDEKLTPYNRIVDRNFQRWVFGKQAGPLKYTEEQMEWLRMIKDYIATSFHIEVDDLDYHPFDGQGGRGKMYKLFGDNMLEIINELNEVLIA